jgi:hypothetical protein
MKNTTKLTIGLIGLLSLSGCLFDSDQSEENIVLADGKYFYIGSDYASGSLECLTPEGASCATGLSVFQDSYVFQNNSSLYVLESNKADNLLRVDASAGAKVLYQERLIDVKDTVSANPKTMAFISDTEAWVGLYATAKLLKVNLADGSITQTVNIPTMADSINPTPSALVLDGGKLYVALQNMTGYTPGVPQVLILDAVSGAIEDTITLTKPNITGLIKVGENLVSLATGNYGQTDGGLELIKLSDKTVSSISDETQLGGKPNKLILGNDNKAWLSSGAWGAVKVSPINLTTGVLGAALEGVVDAGGGLGFDSKSNTLFVNDRNLEKSGVILFRADTLYKGILNTDKLAPYNGTVLRKRK